VRKQTFFQTTQKHERKLQTLGGVESHQGDLRSLIVGIRIAYQSRMIEKLIQSFAPVARIHRRIHQFAQVFNPRIGLGSVFLLKLLDVTRAVDQEFQNFGSVRRLARSAKARLRCRRRVGRPRPLRPGQ
jgi:hypothetical protein